MTRLTLGCGPTTSVLVNFSNRKNAMDPPPLSPRKLVLLSVKLLILLLQGVRVD